MTFAQVLKDAEIDTLGPFAAGAQENIAFAGKYARSDANGYPATRDWQMYFFFRAMPQAEVDRILSALNPPKLEDADKLAPFDIELLNPGLYGHNKIGTKDPLEEKLTDPPAPVARQFYAWLKMVSGVTTDDAAGLTGLLDRAATTAATLQASATGSTQAVDPHGVSGVLSRILAAVEALKAIGARFQKETSDAAIGWTGSSVVSEGLVTLMLYEFLRQIARARSDGAVGIVASGPAGAKSDKQATQASALALKFDPASINLAFTFPGLKQLSLHPRVLRSFPDVFRDGMAARAAQLADTGANAPENWYGELGSQRIHGYFTGGFATNDVPETAWKELRRQIDQFNTRRPEAKLIRLALQLLFAHIGMELMHIELGQAPYSIDKDDSTNPIHPRIEHFGFRDGVSQPFVDMKIDANGHMRSPPSGGGTPRRNRTWAPLAAGEVYLGFTDEDGGMVDQPANRRLRNAGTYVVFRKLAQDVVGFRNFLKAQRPASREQQEYLGAQIVGRWKSGASLVVAPHTDLHGDDARLNDFRYVDGDPDGRKCPLSAHVRRANPRDIGGRNEVRRHRLMRRSMSYGGSILSEDSAGDDEERGLLFVAANSRIDMQFEVIQGHWLNRGEFLGQAGLAKCPLTGASKGGADDVFLEAGKGVPITGLPRFVTLRGGDYFFVPSIAALQDMANGEKFPPEADLLIEDGHSFGDGRTEELFSAERLAPLIMGVAMGQKKAVGYRLPEPRFGQAADDAQPPTEDPRLGKDVVFVRSYKDVCAVLNSKPDASGEVTYTAAHSRIVGRRMLGRGNLLVGTDWGAATGRERGHMFEILARAWDAEGIAWQAQLSRIVERAIRDATERVARAGNVDLVRDLAADATFRVVTDLFGVTAPDYLTELAVATQFARRHISEIHPDWLTARGGVADENPGLVTLQVWSFLVGVNLVADYKLQRPVIAAGQQAAAEALLHIDALIARERERRPRPAPTLLWRFIAIEKEFTDRAIDPIPVDEYYTHVRALIFELALTASAIIPAAFGNLMDAAFRFGIDLKLFVDALDKYAPAKGVHHLIYEIDRLSPSLPLVMRLCERDPAGPLPTGANIRKGQWVAALNAGANFDEDGFKNAPTFSLNPSLPGGDLRVMQNYLMFGVQDGQTAHPKTRVCWGRERIALFTLAACMRAAANLPGLRRVPGPMGEVKKTLGITAGLRARFAPFTPD